MLLWRDQSSGIQKAYTEKEEKGAIMSRAKKAKGRAGEHWIVKWLRNCGFKKAFRVYGSGAFGHQGGDILSGDVQIPMAEYGFPHNLKIEVKTWGDDGGFKTIRKLLGDNDMLCLRRTSERTPLVIMHGATFEELAEIIHAKRGRSSE